MHPAQADSAQRLIVAINQGPLAPGSAALGREIGIGIGIGIAQFASHIHANINSSFPRASHACGVITLLLSVGGIRSVFTLYPMHDFTLVESWIVIAGGGHSTTSTVTVH